MSPQTLLTLTLILLAISGGTNCQIMTNKIAETSNPEALVEIIENRGSSSMQQYLELGND